MVALVVEPNRSQIRWDGRHKASIRTAGLTKNLGHLRAVNEIDPDLPEGVPSTSRPMCGRTGHPVATTPGPYRAEDLAYLVELADTGHYQTVTQTTVDLDDIAPAHRAFAADTGRKRGNVVRIPHAHPEGTPS